MWPLLQLLVRLQRHPMLRRPLLHQPRQRQLRLHQLRSLPRQLRLPPRQPQLLRCLRRCPLCRQKPGWLLLWPRRLLRYLHQRWPLRHQHRLQLRRQSASQNRSKDVTEAVLRGAWLVPAAFYQGTAAESAQVDHRQRHIKPRLRQPDFGQHQLILRRQ